MDSRCFFLLYACLALFATAIGGESGAFLEEESLDGEAFLVAPATAPLGRIQEAFAAPGRGRCWFTTERCPRLSIEIDFGGAVVDEGEEGYSMGVGDDEETCLGRAEHNWRWYIPMYQHHSSGTANQVRNPIIHPPPSKV